MDNNLFIDLNIIYQIIKTNIWYLFKLYIIAFLLFYWLPTKIFPQDFTGNGVKKIVINFIYMLSFIEITFPFLIFIKVFSIFIFIFTLILTKLLFLKFYYKKEIIKTLKDLEIKYMILILDFLDNKKFYFRKILENIKNKIIIFQSKITLYNTFKIAIFIFVSVYLIGNLSIRGLSSYADMTPDVSQFIEWVTDLDKNILYSDYKTFGADFYGLAIYIFSLYTFSNIDPIILFSLYPIITVTALFLSLYFIIKDYSKSSYIALIVIIIYGTVFLSPLSNYLLGMAVQTSSPDIKTFFDIFHIYVPNPKDFDKGYFFGGIPFIRYISGMAYEHSSIFVILNAYFLIKTLNFFTKHNLLLYSLTLFLVFTFHGGGAIFLFVISLLIFFNSILFKKLKFNILKNGLLAILVSSILGNLWILSMLKYGIPEDFGAAAPILDKLLSTKKFKTVAVKSGFESINILKLTYFHFWAILSLLSALFFSFFTKRKFINTSFILIAFGIFIIYYAPNLGFPTFAKFPRAAEYYLFALTILLSFYLTYFFYIPLLKIFKKYSRFVMLLLTYTIFSFSLLTVPNWNRELKIIKTINDIEYTSIPKIILKIHKENQPYTWTVVSYVQEFSKVRNKGFHINTQNFLLKYSPYEKYLKIPTKKIYIFVENFPNPYKGMGEWYYRWRHKIESNLKSWISIYHMFHNNIKIFYKTGTVTVYEIDNSSYIKYLELKKEIR